MLANFHQSSVLGLKKTFKERSVLAIETLLTTPSHSIAET
jgi:hypothetical protein